MSNVPHHSTTVAARRSKGDLKFSAWLAKLGLPESKKGVASRILRGVGPVSLEAENLFREHLGLPPRLPETLPVEICPTCSAKAGKPVVHVVGDCGGVSGEPVILPEGYVVKPAQKKQRSRRRKKYWRPSIPLELRAELEPRIKELIAEALENESNL